MRVVAGGLYFWFIQNADFPIAYPNVIICDLPSVLISCEIFLSVLHPSSLPQTK